MTLQRRVSDFDDVQTLFNALLSALGEPLIECGKVTLSVNQKRLQSWDVNRHGRVESLPQRRKSDVQATNGFGEAV